jgi:hypothetical protein
MDAVVAPADAAGLAQGFVRTFLTTPGSLPTFLEDQRGASIDFEALRPDDRVMYLNSPYLPLPDSVPPATRRV